MLTVTLAELQVNATVAALQDRSNHLAATLVRLKAQPKSPSRDFAIETTEQAIRDCITAFLAFSAAMPDPEYPEDMTVERMTESETRWMWGDR